MPRHITTSKPEPPSLDELRDESLLIQDLVGSTAPNIFSNCAISFLFTFKKRKEMAQFAGYN